MSPPQLTAVHSVTSGPVIALLSNPRSTGNIALLPAIRAFVAAHPNIFHYEVDGAEQVPEALRTIARLKPVVLALNGGDGTVQRALTELHHGNYFDVVPPVAVLPNGKTNLIAHDLGASGDPLAALRQLVAMADAGMAPHVVRRQLIALSGQQGNAPPVLGMFLGGAGLAEIIIYCRHRIYPLGLPNWLSHAMALVALVLGGLLGIRADWLPRRAGPLSISVVRKGELDASFLFLMVTTLENLLYNQRRVAEADGGLYMVAIEQGRGNVLRAAWSMLRGKLGAEAVRGIHMHDGDEIRIKGNRPGVILDGEYYQAANGGSLVLTPTAPVDFVRLAA